MTRARLLADAWIQLGLWLAIALVCNHLASAIPGRLDLTGDQRYSLAPATIEAVTRLDQPLTATVWFTGDLGPPYHNHRQALVDLLTELQAHTTELDVVLRDPTGDPETAAAARRAGIRPVTFATRDWEGSQARQVWMGVSLDQAERHAVVDALPAIEQMEPDLVRAILAVTTQADDRKTVGWLTGNGEPELGSWPVDHPLGKLRIALQARYDVVAVDSFDEPVPDAVDALLVVGPQLAVPEATRQHLDAYLMRGGGLAVYLASWQPDFRTRELRPVPHHLNALLGTWGIGVLPGILLDRHSNEAMVVPVGDGLAQVNYPLAPVSTAFSRAYPPVRDLRRSVLPFATGLVYDGESEAAVWLATEKTTVRSVGHTGLTVESLQEVLPDEQPGPHAALIAVQGSFPSAFPDGQPQSAPTRLVVGGSADLVANNLELVLNSVDWLLEDPRLVSIRARSSGPAVLELPASVGPLKLAIAGAPFGVLGLFGVVLGLRRRSG